jgi:glycosyltransferase involved in cell wall biosynthesis
LHRILRGLKVPTLPDPASCVIVVENLPVPFDRRVWQEAKALRDAGYWVSVICPSTRDYPQAYEVIDGIEIHRHPLPVQARGKFAFLAEYAFALFHEFRLLLSIYSARGISVIQACNPPDLIFLAALPFRMLGVRFIFDQHDLSPELFVAKFGKKGAFYWLLRGAEWLSYKSADFVITANDTFRDIVLERGGKAPDKVSAVYSIPNGKHIYRAEPEPNVAKGRKFVLGYLGIIGDQDGLDYLVRAVAYLVQELEFTDFQALVVGDGPALGSARDLAAELGVADRMTFTGFLSGERLMRHLSAFDIGIIPDPVNETNDKMSMNKVFEYCALGVPTVAFPLTETKRLLGDAGLYAPTPDGEGLARACLELMKDDALRRAKAESAKMLSESAFKWEREEKKYLASYADVLGRGAHHGAASQICPSDRPAISDTALSASEQQR